MTIVQGVIWGSLHAAILADTRISTSGGCLLGFSQRSALQERVSTQDCLQKIYLLTDSQGLGLGVLGIAGTVVTASKILKFVLENCKTHQLNQKNLPETICDWINRASNPFTRNCNDFLLGVTNQGSPEFVILRVNKCGRFEISETSKSGSQCFSIGSGSELGDRIRKKIKELDTVNAATSVFSPTPILGVMISEMFAKDYELSQSVGGPILVVTISNGLFQKYYLWPGFLDFPEWNAENCYDAVTDPFTRSQHCIYSLLPECKEQADCLRQTNVLSRLLLRV